MTTQNFKIKHGLNLGQHEIIDAAGNINLPSGASLSVNGVPYNSLPDYTGQGGKFLSTDGLNLSWLNVPAGYTDTDVSTYLSTHGYDTATNIVASITNTAPETLNTLNELAAALGDDPNFATTLTTALGLKADSSYVDTNLALKADASNVNTALALKADLTGATFTGNVQANNSLTVGTQTATVFYIGVDYQYAYTSPSSIDFMDASPNLIAAIAGLTAGSIVTVGADQLTVTYAYGATIMYNGPFIWDVPSISLLGSTTGSLEVKGPITELGKPVLNSGNISQYALPLTGGNLTGSININIPGAVGGTYPAITLNGSEYSGSASFGVEQNTDRSGGGLGITYLDSIGIKPISFGINRIEKMKLNTDGTLNVLGPITQEGNQVLHIGNYTSYTYSTSQINSSLALKADQSTTYTKTQVDTSLALKADQSTTYTKTQVDTSLALKADQSTTYTKTEVDNAISPKANTTDVNTALALKANQSTTYTKTEVDNSLALKANTTAMNAAIDAAVAFAIAMG